MNTQEVISCVNLGSSNLSTLLASPVIAMGNPLGNQSVVYGMITSIDTTIYMPDVNYKLMTTDIYGSTDAWGILVDFNGKVIGIIHQDYKKEDAPNLISALGILALRLPRLSIRRSAGCCKKKTRFCCTDIPQRQGILLCGKRSPTVSTGNFTPALAEI